MAEKADHLVSTKLFVPHHRQSLVTRNGLLSQFDQCFNYALTLVSAPAGYGKTTLLASWIENMRVANAVSQISNSNHQKKYSWVSLDAEDDDPLRFLSYLAASVEDIQPGLFEIVQSHLNTFPSPALPSCSLITRAAPNLPGKIKAQCILESMCLFIVEY